MAELAIALGAIGAAAGIAGGVSSITQGRDQADAIEAAGQYNAALALQETAVAEERLRRDRERRLGALRAAIGGRGVQLTGSPLAILADQAAEAEEEALLVRFQGVQRAQAIQYGASYEASLAKSQGLAQGILGFGSAATSLLGGLQAGGVFAGGGSQAGTTLLGGTSPSRSHFFYRPP